MLEFRKIDAGEFLGSLAAFFVARRARGRAAGLLRQFLKAGFGFGAEADFRGLGSREASGLCQKPKILRSVVPTLSRNDRERIGRPPAGWLDISKT